MKYFEINRILKQGYIESNPITPSFKLLRLKNDIALLPLDMAELCYVKLVGKLKERSKWKYLRRLVEKNETLITSYFVNHGKESDIEAIFGYFSMSDTHLFVPSKLNAKALVIYYVTFEASKEAKK